MTEGHGTCGQSTGGRKRPQRGRTTSCLATVRPLRGRLESVSAIRRFHDLRSFHQRLFTFAPFGDGRMPHAKVQYFMFCSFSEEINLQIFFRSHKRPWLLPGRCGLSPRICRRGHPSCSCPQSACLPWSPLCRNPRACRCDRRP